MDAERFSSHEDPVWREQANFIINASLPENGRFEQLWTCKLSDDTFEVCCIPFFVYDLALGDIVRTTVSGERRFVLDSVLRRSGRYTFRVWFGQSFQPRNEIASELSELGSLLEWSSRNLLAVDAVDADHAQRVADFLHEREPRKDLIYETGRTR